MAALPFKVKAVFNYDSKHEDDLNFTNGQIITVTDEEDDDWYYGEFPDSGGETQQGLFPRNFVERYEPTTPPRPSRSLRPKREPETEQEPEPDIEPEPEPGPGPELVGDGAVERDQPPSGAAQFEQENLEPTREVLEFGKEAGLDKAAIEVEPVVPIQSGISAEQAPREEQESQVSPRSPTQASKPPAPLAIATTKGPPPAIATKPTSSSFRDRIAAFNKPAAPPIQPIKPGQSSASSFVKKPYVAAPPSRDAYVRPPPEVPPAKQVKTQEESNIRGIPAKEEPRAPASSSHVDNTEDQPKPTSLKERIALLQKQQLEQAARHVEAAQKKEKPKKPPKKKSETSAEVPAAGEEVPLDRTTTGSTVPDSELDVPVASRPLQVRSKSKDGTPVSSSNPPLQELLSDPNDADQSAGGDTEDSEALATTKRVNKASASGQLPLAPGQYTSPPLRELDEYELEADEQEKQGNNDERDGAQKDEENDDEEEDIDPDVKRRMEIRDRMAKMSGGIGMAGMFGVPSGLPSTGAKKAKTNSGASKKQSLDVEASSSASPPFQPVPVMALPGMSMPGPSQVRTPEPMEDPMDSVSNTSQPEAAPIAMPSVQQSTHQEDVVAEQKLKDRNRSYPSPNINSIPPGAPPTPRGVPPVPQTREPLPPPPSSTRPSQALPSVPNRPSDTGSESDDELSAVPQESTNLDSSDGASPTSRKAPLVPPIATSAGQAKYREHRSPVSPSASKSTTSPRSPPNLERRSSRAAPPIPGVVAPTISPPPQSRAPPPPPPTREADDPRGPSLPSELQQEDESEEVTEYEGDYDTDIAAGDTHKDALKAEDQNSSTDDTLTGDEASYHHSGLPSLGPPLSTPAAPTAGAPRGAPPPPPSQPPKPSRQSSEAPRVPPPPPGQPHLPSRQSSDAPRAAPPPPPIPSPSIPAENDDYDPYNYNTRPAVPSKQAPPRDPLTTPRAERPQNGFYDDVGPHRSFPEAVGPAHPPQPPPGLAPAQPSQSRRSLDVPRPGGGRRSIDASRSSMEQGYMANDLDIGRNTQWWVQRKMPPPALQDRSDMTCEIEESTAISPSGEELVMRHIYALYLDLSQTIITARFSPKNPSNAEFSQRHQPPPSALRQDQLESAHTKFGSRIGEIAKSRENSTIGNGTPIAFVMELFNAVPDALPPIGTRAFGALIYTNLANASVQQYDEIRRGDVVTFRNAKFQGHRGTMKQKYNMDVGKPEHVAIVLDWDGGRRKLKAWEQGRESKKVKEASFKHDDLRSGEIKIWRIVSREWVGWGRKS